LTDAYLDTSVVCDAIGIGGASKASVAAASLAKYARTELPTYAIRELRAGALANHIYAHNCVASSTTLDEAIDKMGRVGGFQPRKTQVALAALIRAVAAAYTTASSGSKSTQRKVDPLREAERILANKTIAMWASRNTVATAVVQPLSCYADAELTFQGRLLAYPSSAGGCAGAKVCGAAQLLNQDKSSVTKAHLSLKLPKGTADGREKLETTKRRDALKSIANRPIDEFPLKSCRAIGDAYFCLMAPAGSTILTTNTSDFQAMADALGKTISGLT